MIYISNSAQVYFAKLLEKKEKGTKIRLSVIKPGTPQAECKISYCLPNSTEKDDVVIKFEKVVFCIDKRSVLYLKNTEIDLVNHQVSSQLIVKSPNLKVDIKDKKIIKHSSLEEQVKDFLQFNINPILAKHNGYVSLYCINNHSDVILKFSGGCNGCEMIKITLKEHIEKQLLRHFPELNSVIDFTDHQRGEHSYY